MKNGPPDSKSIGKKRSRQQHGFALLSLATVLVVAGSTALLSQLPERLRDYEKRAQSAVIDNTDRVVAALDRFALLHNRLPCPADGSLALSDSQSGTEQRSPGTQDCLLGGNPADADAFVRAVLPWRALGLRADQALDPWGRQYAYFVYQGDDNGYGNLTQTGAMTPVRCLTSNSAADCLFWSDGDNPFIRGSNDGLVFGSTEEDLREDEDSEDSEDDTRQRMCNAMVQALLTTEASRLLSTPVALGLPVERSWGSFEEIDSDSFAGRRAAYIVISRGENGYGGWTARGTQRPYGDADDDERRNIVGANDQFDFTANAQNALLLEAGGDEGPEDMQADSAAGGFDDIVTVRNIATLFDRLGPAIETGSDGICGLDDDAISEARRRDLFDLFIGNEDDDEDDLDNEEILAAFATAWAGSEDDDSDGYGAPDEDDDDEDDDADDEGGGLTGQGTEEYLQDPIFDE